MKKIFFVLLLSIIWVQITKSQNDPVQGKAITEIFTDFHYVLDDTSSTTGFGLSRAYIGYNFLPQGDFSGTVILNVGSPDDLTDGAKHRKYSFFREASITYVKDNLDVSFGITSTRATMFQQKYIGKRYIAENFQSSLGYCFVADLGIAADYSFNDVLKADFTLMNGEGYSELQLDNSLKTSVGLTITPNENAVLRIYGDIYRPEGIWQSTLIGFAGLKTEGLTIGVETSYKTKLDLINGHNAWGISCTCAQRVSEKTEIFARGDYTTSSVLPGDDRNWNFEMDGKLAVLGFQYTCNQNVRFALDYQSRFPKNQAEEKWDAIYLNAHFKF